MPSPFKATEKIGWYGDPDDPETWEGVDELIRPACKRICESGWVWTAESCQGHPDAEDMVPWAGNVRPMLRFVTREEHFGHLFDLLCRAIQDIDPYNINGVGGFEVWPNDRLNGFASVLIYLPATCVANRNVGLRVFERFGDLARRVPP